jgi:hypothetical protein
MEKMWANFMNCDLHSFFQVLPMIRTVNDFLFSQAENLQKMGFSSRRMSGSLLGGIFFLWPRVGQQVIF